MAIERKQGVSEPPRRAFTPVLEPAPAEVGRPADGDRFDPVAGSGIPVPAARPAESGAASPQATEGRARTPEVEAARQALIERFRRVRGGANEVQSADDSLWWGGPRPPRLVMPPGPINAERVRAVADAWNPGRTGSERELHELAQAHGFAGIYVNDGNVFLASHPDESGRFRMGYIGPLSEPSQVKDTLYVELYGVTASTLIPVHTLDVRKPAEQRVVSAHLANLAYRSPEEIRMHLAAWRRDGAPIKLSSFAFIDDRETDTQGFVVEWGGALQIVGRGSESFRDATNNLTAWRTELPWRPDRELVHKGFANAARGFLRQAVELIIERGESIESDTLALAGHSLGAGYMTVVASWLVDGFPNQRDRAFDWLFPDGDADMKGAMAALLDAKTVYTGFGSPRVGNGRFVTAMEARFTGDSALNYAHAWDPVTGLPFEIFGYRDIFGPLVFGGEPERLSFRGVPIEDLVDEREHDEAMRLVLMPREDWERGREQAIERDELDISWAVADEIRAQIAGSEYHSMTYYAHAVIRAARQTRSEAIA
ncbi:MAG: hypothetical protein AAF654_01180 [Myxococcota bacterium]